MCLNTPWKGVFILMAVRDVLVLEPRQPFSASSEKLMASMCKVRFTSLPSTNERYSLARVRGKPLR